MTGSHSRLAAAVFLLAVMLVLGSARTASDSASRRSAVEIESITFDIVEESYHWIKADESDAEIVLIISVTIPTSTTPRSERFPLKTNPNGHLDGIPPISMSCRACGKRGGLGRSISANDIHDGKNSLSVSVSVDWRLDDRHGEFKDELQVPWLGDVKHELGEGSSVRVHFEKPPQ